jgi:hypothetical protein
MFCKRLQATMTVSTCQKRQKKALTYMEYEACRDCPQSDMVNAGRETDHDIFRIIKEISLQSPLGVQPLHENKDYLTPAFKEQVTLKPERTDQRGFGRKRPKQPFSGNASF